MLLRLSLWSLLASILIACSEASIPAPVGLPAPSAVLVSTATIAPTIPTVVSLALNATATVPPVRATPARPILQDAASQAAWREDLHYLAEQLRTRHPKPFYRTPETEFQSLVDTLDRDIPFLTREQILTGFIHLSALIDGHTNLPLLQPALGFHLYALRLYAFSEGLYVIAAPDAYREAVGARIVRIGKVDAAQAWTLLAPLAQHDNESSIQLFATIFHLVPEVLHALGIVDDVAKPEFVLEKPNGQRITLNPTAQAIAEYQQWTNAVFYGLPKLPQPLTLSRRDEVFWFTYLRDSRTLYIEYNQVRPSTQGGDSLSSFSQKIAEFVAANDVQKTVVDIRHNGGGDNTTYGPFLNLLLSNPAINQRGRLYVIIGRQTFSAATNFVTELEHSSSVIFAGEPTGGSPNLYGDVRSYTLPNSKLSVQISARYWEKSTPDDHRPAITPQISAALSPKDYFAGLDPALEAVLGYTLPVSQSVTFATEDGVRLGGTVYGSGTKAVIFSNIGSGTQPDWQDLPGLLAERGYLVLTYDWRGFGASQGAQAYTLADKDLRAAIAYLRTQGAKRLVLVGGSLGGMASLMNADIAELAGIVVIGSPREAPNFKVSEQQIVSIGAPKLFVGSRTDRTVAYAETVALYQLAIEPKTLQTYEGSAHGSDLLKSADREHFVKLLLDFVGGALKKP